MTELEKIKKLTGEKDEELLSLLFENAESFILDQTNRTVIPDKLKAAVRDLTVVLYNRLGTEGEKSRSEAGESYSFADIPENIARTIKMNSLARCGGHAFEKIESSDTEDSK